MADAVRAHDGGIVKTIGDAVMAAFSNPADAMRAALAVQRNMAQFNRDRQLGAEDGLVIVKLGLHGGPCIVVTLNDRLDYFGSTANLAARLQGRKQRRRHRRLAGARRRPGGGAAAARRRQFI